MNEQSRQNHNPGSRRSRARRKSARRRRLCFFALCICAALIAVLSGVPAVLRRIAPFPEETAYDPLSFLQDKTQDSVIRITNLPGHDPDGDSSGGSSPAGASNSSAPEGTSGVSDGSTTAGASGDSGTSAPADASGDTNTPWYLLLVNRNHPLPEGWQERLSLTELDNGQSVDSRIYPSLQSMFDAMRADGVYPVVASGFRTAEKQQSLMDEKIASFQSQGYSAARAKEEAEKWVAIPGTSEHQLGSAVDINADGIHSAGYQVYEWLDKHAHEYGFIHRYPDDKTEITGISNEPWHYRYVGTDAAAEIHRLGVCLEEYLNAGPVSP